jgi:CRP/FNR family nitrogen fixation transcriptional regulator
MIDPANSNTPHRSAPSGLSKTDVLWSEFKHQRDTSVFEEAEPAEYVYHVRDGAVRTCKRLSDGRRQISAFHLPGDIFGFENSGFHRFTAEAIIDTTVWMARRQDLFGEHTGLNDAVAPKDMMKLITRSLQHAEDHLLLLGRQNSLEKVAAFLLEMDLRLQKPDVMVLPMNRRDIADYLGLTLETVSRSLSMLRQQEILDFVGQTQRKIVLCDRPKLGLVARSAD